MGILPSNVVDRDYQIGMMGVVIISTLVGTIKLVCMRKNTSTDLKAASKIAFLFSLITSLPWFVSWFWDGGGGPNSFFSWFYFIVSTVWTILGIQYSKSAKKMAEEEGTLGEAIVTAVAVPVPVYDVFDQP